MVPPPPPPSPSPSPAINSQYTEQFLSNALSQRGPSSLPYSDDVKWLIRQHLLSLTDTCPSLQLKISNFGGAVTVNLLQLNGTVPMVYQNVSYNIPVIIWLTESYPCQSPLVFVNPTLNMVIKSNHPFVDSSSGIVLIPYLINWVYPSSNLVELIRNISCFFSFDPPLYTQNPNPNGSGRPGILPRVYPPSTYESERIMEVDKRNVIDMPHPVSVLHRTVDVPCSELRPYGSGRIMDDVAEAEVDNKRNVIDMLHRNVPIPCPELRGYGSGTIMDDVAEVDNKRNVIDMPHSVSVLHREVVVPCSELKTYGSGRIMYDEAEVDKRSVIDMHPPVSVLLHRKVDVPFPELGPYGSGRIMDDEAEVDNKRNVIHRVVVKLRSDIGGLREAREVDMEGLFSVDVVLRRREEELRKGVKELVDEIERLEQELQMVLMNTDVLEGWVRDNEVNVKKFGNMDVDEVFEPCDTLSKQMLDCTALDLAMEDVIYSLDKAVQQGVIPFDQYLRNVRLLSREQFIHRAMASKVKAAQMQAQVTNMASRLAKYAMS